jgi:hypothetical protein
MVVSAVTATNDRNTICTKSYRIIDKQINKKNAFVVAIYYQKFPGLNIAIKVEKLVTISRILCN